MMIDKSAKEQCRKHVYDGEKSRNPRGREDGASLEEYPISKCKPDKGIGCARYKVISQQMVKYGMFVVFDFHQGIIFLIPVIPSFISIFLLLLVLFVEKVPKIIQGAQTRSPLQQVIFRIPDAQTVFPLKIYFYICEVILLLAVPVSRIDIIYCFTGSDRYWDECM